MEQFLQQLRTIKWIDITRTIGWDNLDFPQDEPVEMKRVMERERGDIGNLTRLSMSAHAGTHMDAPAHFVPGTSFLEEIAPERFISEVRVVEVEGKIITAGELRKYTWNPGQAVLFKTSNGDLPRDYFRSDYVAMELAAAEYLVQQGIRVVGIDYLSVDAFRRLKEGDTPGSLVPVHEVLLQAGCLILEDVNLAGVQPGRYLLVCLPLKYYRSDGAPCRCLLGSL